MAQAKLPYSSCHCRAKPQQDAYPLDLLREKRQVSHSPSSQPVTPVQWLTDKKEVSCRDVVGASTLRKGIMSDASRNVDEGFRTKQTPKKFPAPPPLCLTGQFATTALPNKANSLLTFLEFLQLAG